MTPASSRGNRCLPHHCDGLFGTSLCLALCLLQRPEGEQESPHEEREQGLLLQGTDHRAGATGGKGPFKSVSTFVHGLNVCTKVRSLFVLQELKKKKGIKEELQLTSKQKEMMQNQLEKEAAIRKRLQGV